MTGKPAARITDRVSGGQIVTGSATVLIGSQGGLACSVCPGGVTVGSPVNPQLGAKVLLGAEDLDFALPGPLPLVWQRQYSSYVNAEHGAPCGPLGHGWKHPRQISIRLDQTACRLFDAAGRTITFEALPPGQQHYSASEDLWLLRGGAQAQAPGGWARQGRWSHLSETLTARADTVIAASGDSTSAWVFAPETALQSLASALAPIELRLSGQLDRFGRSQRYEYTAAAQDPSAPSYGV